MIIFNFTTIFLKLLGTFLPGPLDLKIPLFVIFCEWPSIVYIYSKLFNQITLIWFLVFFGKKLLRMWKSVPNLEIEIYNN